MEKITDRQFEIIQAAGKILTNSGLSGLTIKNLAKEMQFSEAAIYRHFASKEKIIIAMLDFLANDMDSRLTAIIDHQLSTEQKFVLIFQNQFEFFHNNPHFVVAVFSDGLMEESKPINKHISAIMEIKMSHLNPIISEGQTQGIFTSELSNSDLLHITMGAMRLQMYKWRIANFEFDITKKGKEMIQSVLTLIKLKS